MTSGILGACLRLTTTPTRRSSQKDSDVIPTTGKHLIKINYFSHAYNRCRYDRDVTPRHQTFSLVQHNGPSYPTEKRNWNRLKGERVMDLDWAHDGASRKRSEAPTRLTTRVHPSGASRSALSDLSAGVIWVVPTTCSHPQASLRNPRVRAKKPFSMQFALVQLMD
jgi:hypothetical protein